MVVVIDKSIELRMNYVVVKSGATKRALCIENEQK